MRIILERHAYAPELNIAYVGPSRVAIPAPRCKSIADVRKALFAPLSRRGRFVTMQSRNTAGIEICDKNVAGFVTDTSDLGECLKAFKKRCNLPGCRHLVKIKLIG